MNDRMTIENISLKIPQGLSNVLDHYIDGLKALIQDNLCSVILHGSVATEDFDPISSDVDLLIITNTMLTQTEFYLVSHLHNSLKNHFNNWSQKLEVSYITTDEFYETSPPNNPRIYLNSGVTKYEPYGAEWHFEKYTIKHHGQVIYGKEIDRDQLSISSTKLRVAAYQILLEWWKPIIEQGIHRLSDDYLSYGVMTMCRMIFTIETGKVDSKKVSVNYVLEHETSAYDALLHDSLAHKPVDRVKSFEFIKQTVIRYI